MLTLSVIAGDTIDPRDNLLLAKSLPLPIRHVQAMNKIRHGSPFMRSEYAAYTTIDL